MLIWCFSVSAKEFPKRFFKNAEIFLVCIRKKAFLLEAKLGDDSIPRSLQSLLQNLRKTWLITVIQNFLWNPNTYDKAWKWAGKETKISDQRRQQIVRYAIENQSKRVQKLHKQ